MSNMIAFLLDALSKRIMKFEVSSIGRRKKKTIMNELLIKIVGLLRIMQKIAIKYGKLHKIQKMNWLILIGLTVTIVTKVIKNMSNEGFKEHQQKSNESKKHIGLPPREQMLKMNPSLLSIRQYCSHSESESQSQRPQTINQSQIPKLLKEGKQFCTDIETSAHQMSLQAKRDKFFFKIMNKFQKQGKQNSNESLSCDQYSCQYEAQVQQKVQTKRTIQINS